MSRRAGNQASTKLVYDLSWDIGEGDQRITYQLRATMTPERCKATLTGKNWQGTRYHFWSQSFLTVGDAVNHALGLPAHLVRRDYPPVDPSLGPPVGMC